ncbi:MAG: hypothetical protein HC923_08235 [Myxococcales bacterium]|nr:hypothetical protein [Myxococcales bacterium]
MVGPSAVSLAVLCLNACATSTSPAPPNREVELPADPWRLVQVEGSRFASEVLGPAAAPARPAEGEVLVADPAGMPVYDMAQFVDGVSTEDPARVEEHRPVQVHNLVVRRRPTAILETADQIVVRTQSDRPIAGGRIDFGVRVRTFRPMDRLVRKAAPIELLEDGWIRGVVPIHRILTKKHDVDDIRDTGRGVLALRIRLLDRGIGVERFEDIDVPFRCEPTPCTQDSRFVQLPAFRMGPLVDLVREDSAIVSFETDVPTTARVVVIDGEEVVARFDAATENTRHEVPLTGATAGEPLSLLGLRQGRVRRGA